jgi:hypothetical protein
MFIIIDITTFYFYMLNPFKKILQIAKTSNYQQVQSDPINAENVSIRPLLLYY